MTQYTPEQARHIAGCMERGAGMRNVGAPALRSLADQVEALTAERDEATYSLCWQRVGKPTNGHSLTQTAHNVRGQWRKLFR